MMPLLAGRSWEMMVASPTRMPLEQKCKSLFNSCSKHPKPVGGGLKAQDCLARALSLSIERENTLAISYPAAVADLPKHVGVQGGELFTNLFGQIFRGVHIPQDVGPENQEGTKGMVMTQ